MLLFCIINVPHHSGKSHSHFRRICNLDPKVKDQGTCSLTAYHVYTHKIFVGPSWSQT
uniref:Uncharacterized protein n=1 Tax=Arion vulgaris TaxID=1028688 RepID=A0A0B6XXS7_9EUPU